MALVGPHEGRVIAIEPSVTRNDDPNSSPANFRPVVLICSAWPPGVGGAVSFALRVTKSPRITAAFEIRRQQILKRPSIFVPQDKSMAVSVIAPALKVASGLFNLFNYVRLLIIARPRIVHFNYNGKMHGALNWEAAVYLVLARCFRARTAVRLGGHNHFFELATQHDAIPRSLRAFIRHLDLLVVQCNAWRDRYKEWLQKTGVSMAVVAVPNTVDLASSKK
jgi:hypothetical protein